MRGSTRGWTAAVCAAVLSVLSIAAGCGGGSGEPDAGPGPGIDAAQADAGGDVIDAAPPAPDAGPGPATITVHGFDYTEPVIVGATVVWHHPDGTVQEETVTDAQGKSTAVIVPGSLVTVAYTSPFTGLITIAGVQPGDELFTGDPDPPGPATNLGSFTVTWPSVTASGFDVAIGCTFAFEGPEATGTLLDYYDNCPNPFDVVVMAYDAGGTVSQYSVMAGVSFVDMGTVSLPAFQNGFATQTVTVNGLGGAASVRGATFVGELQYMETGAQVSTGMPAMVRYPTGFGNAYELSIGHFPKNGGFTRSIRRSPTPPADVTLDAASELLPVPSGLAFDGATVTVSFDYPGGVTIDGSFVSTTHFRQLGKGSNFWSWDLVLPPGVTELALPSLPSSLIDFMPDASTVFGGNVYVVEGDFFEPVHFRAGAGSGQARQLLFETGFLPASGHIRVATDETPE